MRCSVRVTEHVESAILEYLDYLAFDQQVPQVAQDMFERLLTAETSLETFPHRCPIAPEDEFFEFTVRMLIVTSALLLYRVDDDAKIVTILGFRHGRQDVIQEFEE